MFSAPDACGYRVIKEVITHEDPQGKTRLPDRQRLRISSSRRRLIRRQLHGRVLRHARQARVLRYERDNRAIGHPHDRH
jgi:hypothetical protein